MQVEGIYTAEPRFEAKAKALKLKQEMAAAAEEGRKRLRGMPGLDLVETPKPLERQIRTEVEARVLEEVWKPKTTRVFEKPEIYDRTVTPSSIAGLGEAAQAQRGSSARRPGRWRRHCAVWSAIRDSGWHTGRTPERAMRRQKPPGRATAMRWLPARLPG